MGSAKVVTKEIDMSTKINQFPGSYGAIVIPAKKGKVNEPFFISNETQFLKTFTPDERVEVGYDLSYFSALNYLQKSDKLWVVRAAKNALHAGLSLKKSGGSANQSLVSGLADPTAYVFDSNPDVVAVSEVTNITCMAASGLNEKYFFLNDTANGHYVWYNVDGLGVDPSASGTRTPVMVSLVGSDSAVQVAVKTAIAIDNLASYSVATPTSATITVVNANGGMVNPATSETSGFTISVVTSGSDAINLVDECLLIHSANAGAWGNDIAIKLMTYTSNPDKVKEPNAFILDVFKSDNLAAPVESFLCSRVPGHRDGYGKNIYVEDVLQSSEYIRAIDNVLVASDILPKDQSTALFLNGGNDGLAVTDVEMIQALNTLANRDAVSVTILMDGGRATPEYQIALTNLAEQRQDCVAILSVPISAEAAVDYTTEITTYRKSTLNLNTSHSAIFSPHVLIYDKFNDRRIYVSPDGFVAAAISETAANFEIWFPPAGFRRGIITVLDLRRKFTTGEMDVLYDAGVNPLRFAPGKGIAIWGQKTLLSRPSALDRLNVRLLLVAIEPAIKAMLEDFLFELNDSSTRSLVSIIISSYMDNILARRGVTSYRVVCDDTNNTSTVIDNNQLLVDLFIKPTRSIEEIPFRVVITSTGVSFDSVAV